MLFWALATLLLRNAIFYYNNFIHVIISITCISLRAYTLRHSYYLHLNLTVLCKTLKFAMCLVPNALFMSLQLIAYLSFEHAWACWPVYLIWVLSLQYVESHYKFSCRIWNDFSVKISFQSNENFNLLAHTSKDIFYLVYFIVNLSCLQNSIDEHEKYFYVCCY